MLEKYDSDEFAQFLLQRLKDEVKVCTDELFLTSPKTQKYHFIIEHTYISPLQNHQLVADKLGMSYSTFARHLSKARNQLLEYLWEKTQSLVEQLKAA
jgi:hypothetical protein